MSIDANFIRESIIYLHQHLKKDLQKEAEKFGVTLPQMRVINEVIKHQNVSIKEISQSLEMTHSTVSEIVERLIQKNILIKTTNLKDKRLVDISLSNHVNGYLETNLSEIINKPLEDLLNRLSNKDQESVEHGFRLLITAMNTEILNKKL